MYSTDNSTSYIPVCKSDVQETLCITLILRKCN